MLPSEVAREVGGRWDEVRTFTLSYGSDRTTREAVEAVLPDTALLFDSIRDYFAHRRAELGLSDWE